VVLPPRRDDDEVARKLAATDEISLDAANLPEEGFVFLLSVAKVRDELVKERVEQASAARDLLEHVQSRVKHRHDLIRPNCLRGIFEGEPPRIDPATPRREGDV